MRLYNVIAKILAHVAGMKDWFQILAYVGKLATVGERQDLADRDTHIEIVRSLDDSEEWTGQRKDYKH